MADILKLISETEAWRTFHKKRGYHIKAAACAIRLKALRDALGCFSPSGRSLAKAKEEVRG
ncbi:hypothetical protein G6L15_08295 [Agrobacterium rhizogenes]|uniref:hypothetical protein n=1 Tax=Rhizobium rhizogenes TaxID=359 RepID=UPI0015747D90|nr:hypothetical protein [Rhizobium rhizogenes]NTG86144.1 hypothetical protein [Rhizobium rhizogenes]